jgi:hypothetical protein
VSTIVPLAPAADVSTIVPLAHAGHWIEGVIYFLPVLLVVGALLFQSWRDRRSERSDD